jgi:hypothetical protein
MTEAADVLDTRLEDGPYVPWETAWFRPPRTDAEVKALLATGYQGSPMAPTVWGLFRCRRRLGDDLLTAWEKTLRTALGEQPTSPAAEPA